MSRITVEISEIQSMTDVEAVKRKRTARKTQLTKLAGQLDTIKTTPVDKLSAKTVQKCVDNLKRSIRLYETLQQQIEKLMVADPALEEEEAHGIAAEEEHEVLEEEAVTMLDKVVIQREFSILMEELRPLLEAEDPDQQIYQESFANLKKQIVDFKRKAGEYLLDPHIAKLVDNLNKATANYQKKAAEAGKHSTTSSRTSTPVPVDLTTTDRADAPSTRTITVASRLRLDLPKFNGEPTEWLNFKALFTAAIERDGTGISNQEKCTHLLNCMTTASAKTTIKQYATITDGYALALQALEDVYGGAWRIYPQHVAAILKPETYSYNCDSLRKMREMIDSHTKGLEQCGGNTLEQFLAALVISRFDKNMLYEWTHHWEDLKTLPTITEVRDFFRKRELRMIEHPVTVKTSNKPINSSNISSKPPSKRVTLPVRAVTTQANNTEPTTETVARCPACKKEPHSLPKCSAFMKLTPENRQKLVREANLCYNCLSHRHRKRDCPSSFTCRTCNGKHHSLLHKEESTNTTSTTDNHSPSTPESASDGGVMVTYGEENSVVLSTAQFLCRNGRIQQQGRALLDSGSVPSLITEALASALQLPRQAVMRTFTGASGKLLKSKHTVELTLSATNSSSSFEPITVTCHIVRQLPPILSPSDPKLLIQQQIDLGRSPAADPNLGGSIDVLLGVSASSQAHTGPRIYTPDRKGYVAPTIFGWIYAGHLPGAPTNQIVLTVIPTKDPLEESLNRLHEMDKVEKPSNRFTTEEQQAVDHFKDHHTRLPSGRFRVTLPRKEEPPTLGTSRPTALKRFIRNEKSLASSGQLAKFEAVLKEYVDLGHAEIVPQNQLSVSPSNSYYLPVHGVTKEASSTTKLRAVFDASCKTSTGVSLNDTLLPGPNLYPLLSSVINRFRMFPIAITADIGKMFREVELDPNDRDYHRFLRRDPDTGTIHDFRMRRLTFGVTSSPFLATQVLLELADQEQSRYPEATIAIRQSFYVDDCLAGASTLEEVKHLGDQLINLLKEAGMTLRKFRSNSPEFLSMLPPELIETEDLEITEPKSSAKTLGIHWSLQTDNLYISTPNLDPTIPTTKRLVASAAAKVYDILGIYSPVTVVARLILQQLWQSGLGWDQPIPADLENLWHAWTAVLPDLAAHPVPRRLTSDTNHHSIQLHGFSDASEKAYGAAVYIRTVAADTSTKVSLVMAKSRVAPIKTLTIPKLELTAALLLAKLLSLVASDLNLPTSSIFAWTDSSVTLHWIHSSPHRLQTYQANRVTAINELIPSAQWRHVSTNFNPADLASRGTTVETLLNTTLWWEGPTWLKLPPEDWPHLNLTYPDDSVGFKPKATNVTVTPSEPPWELWNRYSSFPKLVRIISWIRRFITNCRSTTPSRITNQQLTSEEITNARSLIIKSAQFQSYPEAFKAASNQRQLPKGHSLQHYDIRLNSEGLLEIQGRVRRGDGAPRAYLPLKLDSTITQLLISSLHVLHHHPGASTLLAIISEQYHIPGLRNHLKLLNRKCVTCQKILGNPVNQRMGLLPHHRTTPSKPFDISGVDFAGPFLIHRGNPRKPTRVKVYAAVFVCFTTRALHFELCSDLSANGFIAAFRRFTARRGTPTHLYSDGGSNFVGARREMKEAQTLLHNETTTNHFNHLTTTKKFHWHFSPPRAPHFGGLWEAGVKSMKRLLKRNLSAQPLSYEELQTILIEMEAVLNSRPLTPITSTDPNSVEMLTSGHFLTGGTLKAPPPNHVDTTSKLSLLRRWNLVQRLTRDLWIKWKATYIQSLVARQKWHLTKRNYRTGDIVLLKDDSFEVTRNWPLAIITDTHPGSDDLVRVVDLRCRGRTYRRSTDRLILLLPEEDTAHSFRPGGCLGSTSNSTQSGSISETCQSSHPRQLV